MFTTFNADWIMRPCTLLTLGCGRCRRVGSGAFGVSSVSALSVTTRVGGRTGTLRRAGTQGRQGGQGGRHTLVVVHPDTSMQVEKHVGDYVHGARLLNLYAGVQNPQLI